MICYTGPSDLRLGEIQTRSKCPFSSGLSSTSGPEGPEVLSPEISHVSKSGVWSMGVRWTNGRMARFLVEFCMSFGKIANHWISISFEWRVIVSETSQPLIFNGTLLKHWFAMLWWSYGRGVGGILYTVTYLLYTIEKGNLSSLGKHSLGRSEIPQGAFPGSIFLVRSIHLRWAMEQKMENDYIREKKKKWSRRLSL